jgi:hypothetical protein
MDWLISSARATFGVVLSCFLSKAERQNSQLRCCAQTEPNDPAERASSSLTTGLGDLGCFTLVVPSLFALRQRVGTLRGANGRKLCARNMSKAASFSDSGRLVGRFLRKSRAQCVRCSRSYTYCHAFYVGDVFLAFRVKINFGPAGLGFCFCSSHPVAEIEAVHVNGRILLV